MKIALLTWFNNENYGTVLQLTALSDYLTTNCGAQTEIINYLPQEAHSVSKRETLGDHLAYRVMQTALKKLRKPQPNITENIKSQYPDALQIKKNRFHSFLQQLAFTQPLCDISSLEECVNNYDLFVCGSDQIWNPRILNRVFYLDFVHGVPKISYAASMGVNYIPRYAEKYIRDYLKDFNAVSLREETCRQALEKLYQKPVDVVCDPVFLLSAERWEAFTADVPLYKEGNYILNYYLGDSPVHETVFDTVSRLLELPSHTLPSSKPALQRSTEEDIAAGPAEFLSLVKNASFTVTDSFHAVCFCLIFRIPFCVIYKHSERDPFNQNSRISFLLKKLKLENRIVSCAEDAAAAVATPIDFDEAHRLLAPFIKHSKEYLDRNVTK